MISFFKNKEKNIMNDDKSYSNIAALLIHVAKIDENYDDKEKEIIKKTLIELGAVSSKIDKLISDASIIEENSNQILDFTREVKNAPESDKIRIIESLWKIIYSDDNADMYETNLMRRLAGLLYIDAKTMGDIKRAIQKNKNFQKLSIKNIMTKNPISVRGDTLAVKALSIMNSKKITSLCVHNNKNKTKTIGILHIHTILEANIQ